MAIFIAVLAAIAVLGTATHLRQLAEASGLIEAHTGPHAGAATTREGGLLAARVALRASSLRANARNNSWMRHLHRWAFTAGGMPPAHVVGRELRCLDAFRPVRKAVAYTVAAAKVFGPAVAAATVIALALAGAAVTIHSMVVGILPSVPAHMLGFVISLTIIPMIMISTKRNRVMIKPIQIRLINPETGQSRPYKCYRLTVEGTVMRHRLRLEVPVGPRGVVIPAASIDRPDDAEPLHRLGGSFFDDYESFETQNSRLMDGMNAIGQRLVAEQKVADHMLEHVVREMFLAALRRNKKQVVYRLRVKEGREGDVRGASYEELCQILEIDASYEPAPIRPFMELFGDDVRIVHLSDEVKRSGVDAYDFLCKALEQHPQLAGLQPVARRKDKIFVGAGEKAIGVFAKHGTHWRQPEEHDQDPRYNVWCAPQSVPLRLATILGRKAGLMFGFDLNGLGLLPAETDGTMAVYSGAPEAPLQGTARWELLSGVLRFLKGIIRRPVVVDGETEAEGVSPEAEYGYMVEVDHGKTVNLEDVTVAAFDIPTEETARLNQQLVAFSARDQGASWYEHQEDSVDVDDPASVASPSEQEWLDAGVPPEFALDGHNPKDLVRKRELDNGYRSTVYGAGKGARSGQWLLADNEIRLPARIAKRLNLSVGDLVRVARDPGIPNGASVREFVFAGTFTFAGSDFDEGILLSAKSKRWLTAGGDFDGDAAVIWPKASDPGVGALVAEQGDGVTDAPSARENAELRPLRMSSRKRDKFARLLKSALRIAIDEGSTFSIGSAINTVSRLWATGNLNAQTRAQGQTLGQGAIDALKHAVRMALLEACQNKLQITRDNAYDGATLTSDDVLVEYWQEQGSVAPDMVTAMGILKRSGDGEKSKGRSTDEAWNLLVETAQKGLAASHKKGGEIQPHFGEAGRAFARYVLKLAKARNTYQEASEPTGASLASVLRDHLLHLEEPKGFDKAKRLVKKWGEEIREKIIAENSGAGDEAVAQLKARANAYMVRLRGLHQQGAVNTAALLQNIRSARVLKQLLRPADIAGLFDEADDEVEEDKDEISLY